MLVQVDAELEVHRIHAVDKGTVLLVVRCIRGPIQLGARFSGIQGSGAVVDLELAGIEKFRRALPVLDPVHSALVTLRGSGVEHLRPGGPAEGYQLLRGNNPQAAAH